MDFLLPPLCLNCETPVTQHQTLCAECWKNLHFVAPPLCVRCGAPFDLPVEAGTLCGACLEKEPTFTMARSALLYDDASRPLILKFKHADKTHPVPALANWMVLAGADIWPAADLIVPVPLHRWRLLKRRYNQAALLAQAIGVRLDKPVGVDVLRRVRPTAAQGHFSKKERQANVQGAFAVARPDQVRGKRIVLIDDVLTSGATVGACAKALMQEGASMVNVVSLARTRIAS
ncbi:MAG: ComF family protein [Bdellovibrionales bacterium]